MNLWLRGGDGLAHAIRGHTADGVCTWCGALLAAEDDEGETAPIPVATEADEPCGLCLAVLQYADS